jgi:hypothetical protein
MLTGVFRQFIRMGGGRPGHVGGVPRQSLPSGVSMDLPSPIDLPVAPAWSRRRDRAGAGRPAGASWEFKCEASPGGLFRGESWIALREERTHERQLHHR